MVERHWITPLLKLRLLKLLLAQAGWHPNWLIAIDAALSETPLEKRVERPRTDPKVRGLSEIE